MALHFVNIHPGKMNLILDLIKKILCNRKNQPNEKTYLEIFSVHLGLRISCQLCDYQALSKEKLKAHIQNKHLEGKFMLE